MRSTSPRAAALLLALALGLPAFPAGAADESFTAALDAVDAAQLEFQNGRPERFKALWSHADDVTLTGGFGGGIEKGWAAVGQRLDWAASRFTEGFHENTRLVASSGGELGYVVQRERIRFTPAGSSEPTTLEYRVTMVFRREAAGWRIVHRHADTQLEKAPPGSERTNGAAGGEP